uniref:Uncharacterized protein At5g65660-like n=1 Tax=Nicotiana tabacum TaxID=4097 RepID=A0A1S4C7X2_TOBAC|nr:uncharacterized protein At5g65660-like [Nicotiana tomentosiformis]XP_016497044.1 PREDICTED: uncharacterized protein At5g65660-like [Nicotiana tabacum]
MTENQYYSPSHSDPSRPSLGFPLGTALLLLIIFSLSGIFSCCYHWDKLRSLRRSFSDPEAGDDPSSLKSERAHTNWKQNQISNMSAVLMPGDQVPKFIALPCPCQPLRPGKVVVEMQQPPPPPPSPPKPPHMGVAVPFY